MSNQIIDLCSSCDESDFGISSIDGSVPPVPEERREQVQRLRAETLAIWRERKRRGLGMPVRMPRKSRAQVRAEAEAFRLRRQVQPAAARESDSAQIRRYQPHSNAQVVRAIRAQRDGFVQSAAERVKQRGRARKAPHRLRK